MNASRQDFKAKNGCFAKCLKRYSFRDVKMGGKGASADTKAAAEYPAKLRKIIEGGGNTKHQVFNADETSLFWRK